MKSPSVMWDFYDDSGGLHAIPLDGVETNIAVSIQITCDYPCIAATAVGAGAAFARMTGLCFNTDSRQWTVHDCTKIPTMKFWEKRNQYNENPSRTTVRYCDP